MTGPLKILWVKSGPLFPQNSGGRLRSYSMLTELSRHHEVTYLALRPAGRDLHPEEADAKYAQKKIWIRNREPRKNQPYFYVSLLQNLFFSTFPVVLDRYRNRALAETLLDLDSNGRFDVIVCDFLFPAPNFNFDLLETPTVLFQHNVEAQIWKRMAREKKGRLSRQYFQLQYRRLQTHEGRLSARFDGVITVSPEDTERCREDYHLDNLLGAVPTGVDTEFFQPPTERCPQKGLIGFLGSMDWMPNIDCVRYFADEIFPSIKERHPNCRFRVIGRDPAPVVRRLGNDNPDIEVTGTVGDVRPHLDECEILVVPLRSGGGTRIKIFEAMAQGVPVVSTRIGAEGLPVTNGENILIADGNEDFANAVIQLLESPERGVEISTKAREKLVAEHSWTSVATTFAGHLRNCVFKN